MNNSNDPLDQLFSDAKQAQEKIAETAQLGIETRLQSKLNQTSQSDFAWLRALYRLCAGGTILTLCLSCWVYLQYQETPELTSLLIERWVLGI